MKDKAFFREIKNILIGQDKTPTWIKAIFVLIAILLSFILSVLISMIVVKQSPIEIIVNYFDGAFKRPYKFFYDAAILLAFGIAIVPCFKMRYWNMGANGQFIAGSIVAVLIMNGMENFGKSSTFNNVFVIILMFLGAVVASSIWALIPAFFKARFNTNETLFTLMMNYVAAGLLLYTNTILSNGNSSTGKINRASHVGWIAANDKNMAYLIVILASLIFAFSIYIFISKTKHGYETIVVGDSFKTAKYASMDTKRIISRATIISGIITGELAFLVVSVINRSLSDSFATISFNAILIAWMSNFNIVIMILLSLFLSFTTNGMEYVITLGGLSNNDLVNFIFGLMFFILLLTEFIIKYRINKYKFIDNFLQRHSKEVI